MRLRAWAPRKCLPTTLTRRELALTPMSLMPRRVVALLLASGLLLGLLAGEQLASAQGMRQPSSEASVPAFDLADPAVVEEGSHLFRANCTHYCHGAEGRVSRAPALRGHQFEPGYVYQRIAKGFPPMPAFETVLPSETIWKIVAYVLSLSNAKDD